MIYFLFGIIIWTLLTAEWEIQKRKEIHMMEKKTIIHKKMIKRHLLEVFFQFTLNKQKKETKFTSFCLKIVKLDF